MKIILVLVKTNNAKQLKINSKKSRKLIDNNESYKFMINPEKFEPNPEEIKEKNENFLENQSPDASEHQEPLEKTNKDKEVNEVSKLSPEEQIGQLKKAIDQKSEEIDCLSNSIENTEIKLNEVREELGLPVDTEDSIDAAYEKQKLEKLITERDILMKEEENEAKGMEKGEKQSKYEYHPGEEVFFNGEIYFIDNVRSKPEIKNNVYYMPENPDMRGKVYEEPGELTVVKLGKNIRDIRNASYGFNYGPEKVTPESRERWEKMKEASGE